MYPNGGLMANRTLSRDCIDRTQRYDENTYRRSNERPTSSTLNSGDTSSSSHHQQRKTQPYMMDPYHLRCRSISRDDLYANKTSTKNQTLQPMTRTVSRSVSMLAPWKPKLLSKGYEINYSQEQIKTVRSKRKS